MVHNYLCFPEYRLARELIDQGEVGELQHIAINLLGVSDDPGTDEYGPTDVRRRLCHIDRQARVVELAVGVE